MPASKISLLPYRRSIAKILIYQALSQGILMVIMFLYHRLTSLILWNVGRPAFTSGDLPYMMTSWQGWTLLALGFLVLVIYTVFDINATILMSEKLLRDEDIHVLPLLREAARSLSHFKGIWGFWAILYVSLAAPLSGAAFGITLTQNFVMPNFIISVVRRQGLLHMAYIAGIAALAFIGFVNIFAFDFAILGKMPIGQAMAQSRKIMKKNWKHFLVQYILFGLKWLALLAAIVAVLYALPCILMRALPLPAYAHRAGIIFFSVLTSAALFVYLILFDYYMQMKLTVLYHYYREDVIAVRTPERRRHLSLYILTASVLVLSLLIGLVGAAGFDLAYPAIGHAQIVAHRAGGNLANENTLLALNAAIDAGAYGAEMDVQRTKDGAYIINHDATFSRVCGDSRSPEDMTLAEIKELKVKNLPQPWLPDTEVATMQEMMDAAKGKIHLFIELKGQSADTQMAEDVIAMAEERDMTDQISLISLDYELVDAIETEYPDIDTGYLCYFAFGDVSHLHCDSVLMEEEIATDENIQRIHKAGKKAGVWTVNTSASMMNFLSCDVDLIITDEIPLARAMARVLEGESDEARVLRSVSSWL